MDGFPPNLQKYIVGTTRREGRFGAFDLIVKVKGGLEFIKFPLKTILSREQPGRVAQSVGHLTRKSGVLGSIPGRATYFRYSFRFFKKGSCQLLAKVCARSTG